MTLDDLRAFVAVMQHHSLTRAAQALHLTQSAVSRRIQRLEEALGGPLLDRTVKPPRPTGLAHRIHEQCRTALRDVDGVLQMVNVQAVPSGVLRLGVTQVVGDVVLTSAVSHLREEFPAVQPRLQTDWSAALLVRLANAELDAAAVLRPADGPLPPGLVADRLASLELVVIRGRTSPSPRPARLAQLADARWVLNPDGCGYRAALNQMMQTCGLSLAVAVDTFGIELQLSLVARGIGYGLVPRALLESSKHRRDIEILRLQDCSLSTEVWLVQAAFLGNLAAPVKSFGAAAAARFAELEAAARRARRMSRAS